MLGKRRPHRGRCRMKATRKESCWIGCPCRDRERREACQGDMFVQREEVSVLGVEGGQCLDKVRVGGEV